MNKRVLWVCLGWIMAIVACGTTSPAGPTIIVVTSLPTIVSPAAPPTRPDTTPPSIVTLPATNTPITLASQTALPPTPPPIALPTYYLTATLDYATHFIQVEEQINLVNNSPDDWQELVLNVSTAYWSGIFNLQQVSVSVDGQQEEINNWLDNTMLHVSLTHPAGTGQSIQLHLAYTLTLPPLDPTGWGPTGNAGWRNDVTQVGDWYPALVPYQTGLGWQTWDFYPVGDPVISPLADFHVAIQTSSNVTLVAPGFTGREENTTHYHLKQARAFAFLASHEYIPFTAPIANVPITVYVLEAHKESGPIVVDTINRAMSLFVEQYGPYPYPEFIMAENGFLTAIEYSAIVSLSGYAFDTDTGTPDSLLVALTTHELAHQWWYGAVGNDQVNEPWLDESLAMFSELGFYEHYYPDLTNWWWQFRVDRWAPAGYVDISIFDYPDSPTYVHNMYGQAAHFLADLRDLMGQEQFYAFLRDYYQQNQFDFATGDIFFALALNYSDPAGLKSLVNNYFAKIPPALSHIP